MCHQRSSGELGSCNPRMARGKPQGGRKPREVAVRTGGSRSRHDPGREQDPEAGSTDPDSSSWSNSRRGKAPERAYGSAPGRDGLERHKPQERDRHETGPAGDGRIKTSRARETLRRYRNPGRGTPGVYVAAHLRENAEGEENRMGDSPARTANSRGRTAPGWRCSGGERNAGWVVPERGHLSGHRTSRKPQGLARAKAGEGAENQSLR